MFRPINRKGSVLAGAFLVSVALGIAMVGLLSASRASNKQAESLLSKAHLSRMAHEKFTQDLIALNANIALKTSTAAFPLGEAETFFHATPEGSFYVVVVATLTKNNLPEPRHMRLETLVDVNAWPAAPAPVPAVVPRQRLAVTDLVDNLLRQHMSADDPQFQEMKDQILADLKAQMGADVFSAVMEMESAEYRGPAMSAAAPAEGVFTMQPVSVAVSKAGARVRVWKETTY